MKLRNLIMLVLVLFAVIPVMIAGFFTYHKSCDIVYNVSKKDLEERLDFYLELCDFYGKKVQRNELSREEAIDEIATLVDGPKRDDGTRDLSKGLGKGEKGYMSAWYCNLTYAIHPSREGQKATDPILVETDERLNKSRTKGRISFEYEWWNPGEAKSYKKLTVGDYSESLDLVISTNVVLDEFLLPTQELGIIAIIFIAFAIVGSVITSLFGSGVIAKPFTNLSEISSKIIQGDLSARIDISSSIEEFRSVGKSINLTVENLQDKIESIHRAEAELSSTLALCGDTLNKIVEKRDLHARVDTDKLAGKYKTIGTDINEMVANLQKNINELNKAKGKVEENRTFLQQILNNLPDILVVTDNEGHWIEVSPSFERLTSYTIKEILGKKTIEQPVYKGLPESIELNKQMWEKVYKGEVVQGLDIPWRTKNGKKIILSVSEKLLKDARGNSIGRVFVAKDITELRKHEEELRNTKIREETIVNNALDLIILLDKENRWLMVNPAWEEITGFKQEELQGKITEEQPCVTQETLDATVYDRKLLAQGKIVPPFDIPLVCKDGREIIVSATERPLKDARGRWIGSVFYGRDITEFRKKEEELRETTIDKKYFKEYSKKAIELADSWGMGEVFKHEMEEWVKKHKPRQRRKKERL